jgi:hypothetical protein
MEARKVLFVGSFVKRTLHKLIEVMEDAKKRIGFTN